MRVIAVVVLSALAGVAVDHWVFSGSSGGPQQRLAAAMAGLFAGGLVAVLFAVATLLRKRQ